jgi:hypothetical protein
MAEIQREQHLVKEFESNIVQPQNPFAVSNLAFEFNYQSGRVDMIGKTNSGDLIAFEAKISRWRIALNQAYRSSSFAHYSYVVLPESTCRIARQNPHEFERRGVGLCSVSPSGIKVEIPASKKEPIQPWLTIRALEYIGER